MSAIAGLSSEPVRLALVGCGAVSELFYAPALRELERSGRVAVAAVCDPDGGRRDVLRRAFPSALAAADLAEILELRPDLAVVASPPSLHARQSSELLSSGVAVLSEKPLAVSVTEGEALASKAQSTGLVLAVGHFRRFFPALQVIKSAVTTGALGAPLSFECLEGGPVMWPATSAAVFQRQTAGGGVLLDVGVHVLDLVVWWFGEPDEVDYADDAMGGLEANCLVRLKYKSGLEGLVRLSRDWYLPNRYTICCEKGWIGWRVNQADGVDLGLQASDYALNARIHELSPVKGRLQPGEPASGYHRAFVDQLAHVVEAVKSGSPPAVHAPEALRSLRLIDKCYRSRKLLEMPWLDEEEREQAHVLSAGCSPC